MIQRRLRHFLALGMLCLSLGAWAAPSLPMDLWQRYKDSFMTPEGRIIDPVQGGISHSEGQGYGMLLALAAEDRAAFESLWAWTQTNLQREDKLFAWRWDPRQSPPVQDWNQATDGDLLIAWALAAASERWQNPTWRAMAATIATRIRTSLVAQSPLGPVILPAQQGFQQAGRLLLNPSYWVFPAFKALHVIDPNPIWPDLIRSGQTLLAFARFGPHQLPADWVALYSDGRLGLVREGTRARFGFEAIRVPLYQCWAGMADPIMMQGLLRAWPNDQAPAWFDLSNEERAAYPLGLSQRAIRQLALSCQSRTRTDKTDTLALNDQDYYGSTLLLLSQLAISQKP